MSYYIPEYVDENFRTNIINIEPIMFRRPYELQQIYKNHIKKIKNYNIDIEYIKNEKNVIMNIDHNTILTKNKYEYSKSKNMDQYVIWTSNHELSHDDLINKLKDFIGDKQYMLWTNSKSTFASIPQIKHYHLIIRNITANHIYDLEKVIIIARHGPREPIDYFPNISWKTNQMIHNDINKLDQKDKNSVFHANLTVKGKEYCTNQGKLMRKIYGKYLEDLNLDKILVGYSGMQRTYESAKSFMHGFMPNHDFKINEYLDLTGYNELVVDGLNHYEHFMRTLQLENHNSNLHKNIKDILGVEINHTNKYYDMYSTTLCHLHEHGNLPKEYAEEIYEELEVTANEFYDKLFTSNNNKYRDIVTKNVLNLIDNLLKNTDLKFIYLSSHDSLIYPLARYLNPNNDKVHLPHFCSNIRYEVWKCDNDKIVRIYYDDMFIAEFPFSL